MIAHITDICNKKNDNYRTMGFGHSQYQVWLHLLCLLYGASTVQVGTHLLCLLPFLIRYFLFLCLFKNPNFFVANPPFHPVSIRLGGEREILTATSLYNCKCINGRHHEGRKHQANSQELFPTPAECGADWKHHIYGQFLFSQTGNRYLSR